MTPDSTRTTRAALASPAQARRRAAQMEAVAHISRQLTMLQDLDQLLATTVTVVREKFGFYQAHIMLVDELTHELVLREASGAAAEPIKRRGLRLRAGEGITGWVVQSGEPRLCNDVRREPRYRAEALVPDTQAELAVPLRLGERVIGVLDVQSAQRGVFQTEDILTLQLIADQVAIAIENARLFQETKKRLDAMRALHEVSLDIVGKLELSALLNTLLERAARLVHAESAVLAIYDQDSGLIRNIANYQTVRDWTGFTRRPGEGIIGMVIQTGEPLIINDYAQWSHALAVFSHVEQNAMLCVPLRWHDHVIGALLMLNRPQNHLFTLDDQWVLSLFADLAAIAFKNAELYAQVQAFSRDMEQQVAARTQELEQARQQLLEKTEQVQWLLSKTVHIQEEERARIARDLHDSVTQLTIGALFELQAAKADLDLHAAHDAREKINMARELLKQIERELRQAIYDLRPTLLDASGLAPALQKYVASFQELSGVQSQVQVAGTPTRLPSPVEVVIFRIAQEALHNIMAHARAQTAELVLDFQTTQMCLTVSDDGQGFELERARAHSGHQHLGLISMSERAAVIGGQLEVWSQPGQGTRITLRVATDAGRA